MSADTAPAAALDRAIAALAAVFDARTLLVGDAVPAKHATDWSGLAGLRPAALLRPASTEDVAAILRISAEHGVPVVPQGGLTGLCGGAVPSDGAIALSLERLTGIEEIDVAGATVTVRAGTPLEAIQTAAAEHGLYMPLDLGARGSCTIGGNIATNAGGNRVIRYGMMRDMVLGLEVVLADGTVVTALNRLIKNNAAYDLKQIFIGSEGTLGVVTRAVLRLAPLPAFSTAAFCALQSFDEVVAFLGLARRRLGAMLSAFEVMWGDYLDVVGRSPELRLPLARGFPFYVLIEVQGSDEVHDAAKFDALLEALAEDGTFADAVVARSLADVKAFWEVRDAVSEFPHTFGAHVPFDIGLQISRMEAFVADCRAALAEALTDGEALFYGHIGDGNLHIVARDRTATELPKQLISDVVYGLVGRYGGTVSAEHGIGITKKDRLSLTRSPNEIAVMQRLKAAFDPHDLLNPGKVL
jgi:FAD/FMN-containing dehydrogenase